VGDEPAARARYTGFVTTVESRWGQSPVADMPRRWFFSGSEGGRGFRGPPSALKQRRGALLFHWDVNALGQMQGQEPVERFPT